MSHDTILMIAIGLAVLVFVSLRQLAWQPVDLGKLARTPIVMAGLGIFSLYRSWDTVVAAGFGGLDVLIIGLELILALAGGRLMGTLSELSTDAAGTLRSRLRPVGLLVWFGFIALRIGFTVVGRLVGAELASNTVLIMFMLAVVKGVQAVTMYTRVHDHRAQTRAVSDARSWI